MRYNVRRQTSLRAFFIQTIMGVKGVPTWLLSAIFSLVVGILGYFIKKTLDNFSKGQEAQREEFKAELKHQREDFREALDTQGRRLDSVEETLRRMPFTYTLKEDFIRSMSSVDRKLDQIIDMQRAGKEAKS